MPLLQVADDDRAAHRSFIATLGDKPPSHPVAPGPDRLRWVSAAANEVADGLVNDPPDQLKARLQALTPGNYTGVAAALAKRLDAGAA